MNRTIRADIARLRARGKRLRHRSRVRQPKVADCKVIDTRVDSRGRLNFELSNGQAVRADRAAHRDFTVTTIGGDPGTTRIVRRKGRRLAKFKNPIICATVEKEIELNAARAEKAAA
jgi:hypothetical protein